MCKANVTLTHEVLHWGAHFGPEHALAKSEEGTHQANVTRVSLGQCTVPSPECTEDKQARSEENQVPLNNQRITKLEKKGRTRIALMNADRTG